MFLATLPIEEAVGHILRHNIARPDGRRAFAKGHHITATDVPKLRDLGLSEVRVAILDPSDVHEDIAAKRLAAVVAGSGVLARPPASSRVNLWAAVDGVLHVDVQALWRINAIDGLTIATLPQHRFVRARQRIATIKIIPFAVPEHDLQQAVALISPENPVLEVQAVRSMAVGVVLVGSAAVQSRIEESVYPAIASRVQELGSHVLAMQYVPSDEQIIADALLSLRDQGAELLIVAGETSIMDRDDVTPQGIRLAGGRIEHYGAPVEPGNLLLLAYLDEIPVLGAPGCVRSRDTNIVDLLLPRLLAGEHLDRLAIIALGHGGLL
jgi:molybdenum cofactor cytidylyltransferase